MIIPTLIKWSLIVSNAVCSAVILPQAASGIEPKDTTSSTPIREPSNVDKYIAQWEELYEAYGFHSSAHGVARANDGEGAPPASQEKASSPDASEHPANNTLYKGTVEEAATKTYIIPESSSDAGDLNSSTNTPENNDKKSVSSEELPDEEDVFDEKPSKSEVGSTGPYYTPPRPSGFVSGSHYDRVDSRENSSPFSAFALHIFKRDIEDGNLLGVSSGSSTFDDGSYVLGEGELSEYADSIEDLFNDDLGLDEYEFGYDDRDAYKDVDNSNVVGVLGGVNPEEFAELNLTGDQAQDGQGRRRVRKGRGNRVVKGIVVDHCGRPLNGTSIVVKNATLETPSNSTLGISEPRVDSMTGFAARTKSKAMLAMTVFCGMALVV